MPLVPSGFHLIKPLIWFSQLIAPILAVSTNNRSQSAFGGWSAPNPEWGLVGWILLPGPLGYLIAQVPGYIVGNFISGIALLSAIVQSVGWLISGLNAEFLGALILFSGVSTTMIVFNYWRLTKNDKFREVMKELEE